MFGNRFQCEVEWWRVAFDEDWAQMFAYKTRDAPKEARAIRRMLDLPARSKVLDLCCGDGRISLQLARLGYHVTGLDLSLAMLQLAQRKAKRANLRIRWIQLDMRDMAFSEEFDAIINISTSFGFFANEQDNVRTLYSAANALRKEGKLLLDLENVYYLSHMARLYGTTPTYQPVDRFKGWLEEATFFDPISHNVQMNLRLWREETVIKEVKGIYRVYSFPEMRSLLESSGFRIRSIYGDFRLRPYNVDSPRMIVLCEKPQ